MEITQEKLKEYFRYKPDTGELVWIKSPNSRVKAGQKAGTKIKQGYIQITFFGKSYRAHRLIWLYVTGRLPNRHIDHINHIGTDNRFCNLREVTEQENMKNRSIPSTNKSGHIGVFFMPKRNKWRSQIMVERKNVFLGYFENKADAIKARKKAEIEFCFHKNHGVAA